MSISKLGSCACCEYAACLLSPLRSIGYAFLFQDLFLLYSFACCPHLIRFSSSFSFAVFPSEGYSLFSVMGICVV